ncbi:MAG TPA: nicotinate (nicotinamide) nucleotide adenylyltransferase [Treponemataceae bacterium]|nr:nicotinate (nicotinamide) nucleotide adenylyltransferase [Treponemataceae bacterium]
MGQRIAILGGTFNPIHNGHLALAEAVVSECGYDKVVFIPAFYPPHKKFNNEVSDADRLKMLILAIKNNPAFEVETCEIDRGGISYTIDTIEYLYNKYNGENIHSNRLLLGKIALVIGDDLAKDFYTWKSAKLLEQKTDIILARRIIHTNACGAISTNSNTHDKLGNFKEYTYQKLENAVLPISSSDIRKAIKNKKAWRYFVPPAVYEYIKAKKLYVEKNETKN